VTAAFQGEAGSSGAPDEGASGPYDEMSSVLAELPRPRPVRMSRRGKMNAMIISIALLASLGIFAAGIAGQSAAAGRNAGSPNFLTSALPIVLILVIAPLMLRTLGQQKVLLAEGEMVMGQVTKRWIARNGPNIRYEFNTPLGEHFSRGAADGSRQLSVGMNVPIFYDPQKPKKQLALCASFYEVVLPGKE
jgi:hypothetical protein